MSFASESCRLCSAVAAFLLCWTAVVAAPSRVVSAAHHEVTLCIHASSVDRPRSRDNLRRQRAKFVGRGMLWNGNTPYKSLGATADIHRARSRKKALTMPSPTDRNLTALPTKTVKLQSLRSTCTCAAWPPLARSGSGPVGILTRCQCALRSSSTPVS